MKKTEKQDLNKKMQLKNHSQRTALLLGFFLIALFFFFVLDLVFGSVNIPLGETLSVILGNTPVDDSSKIIIMDLRLPRALAAVFGGAALAVAGLLMQTLFRNPLAGPFILGISSGASLGVAIVILLFGGVSAATLPQMLRSLGFLGSATVAMAAFLGSSAVLMIVLFVSRKIQSNVTILILGLMFGYITNALVTILIHFSDPEKVKAFSEWTFGTFDIRWTEISILAPVIIIALIFAFLLTKPLNALLLGEEYATSMGMNFSKTRSYLIIITALLAGVVTAFCGPITFLGVAVPHLCRGIFVTADHRILVPGCTLIGGGLALFADMIAHLPGSSLTLPLSSVTSMLGAPVIIWVILYGNKLGRGVSV
ncbi:ABC-type Fe3+-siderophore transport system, permease component [Methanolobus tindarius DSM 2278]|uniref:ABC-type Fe3+-siderophore transport system, permease component n=1 Tax=Methanolobus tindarius DSM 2278 TaxID=1090322 RepID=W9DMQ4_METTI|nr:iron ABC transporter permease [Methanolobus tindarius]ETA66929.1 ABC-type Fe3+-siderophore transport system, permease component [Methanolobus tindarius DSM 2278]